MQSRERVVRRQPANQRKKTRRPKKANLVGWGILVAVVLIAIYCIHLLTILGVGTPRFYNGVFVYGVDLSGYTYSEGYALMEQMVEEWRDRTFTFTYLENSWQLKASDIDADLNLDQQIAQAWNLGHTGSIFSRKSQILSLRANPVYLTCEPTYDEAKLDAFIEEIRQQIDLDPVDAEVVLTAEKPELKNESRIGYQLDVENFKQQVVELLEGSNSNNVVALAVNTLQPAVSSSSASDGLQLVVEWSTDTSSSSKKRLANVALALGKFNGMAIYPGTTVSFNEVVGKRTVENGFNEAPEYNGTTVISGIGGGTCQASSTLYGALLLLNLQIDKRGNHSMTVGYTSPSFDAVVSDSGRDLVFTNNTSHVYYFYTSVDSEKATVRVYGDRLDYRIEIESVITRENIESSHVEYEDDVEGTYAWYTDEVVLKKTGKKGLKSKCLRYFYDWDTGELVKTEEVSSDTYYAQPDTYYRGIHDRQSEAAADGT